MDNSNSLCVEVQRDEVAVAVQKLNLGKVELEVMGFQLSC